MSTPACPVCGRWNDPTGGPDAHSGGCENTGKPYPGSKQRVTVQAHVDVHPTDTMMLLMAGGDITEGRYAGTTFGCTPDQSGLWLRVVDDGKRGPLVVLTPQRWAAMALDAATIAAGGWVEVDG